LNDRHDGSTGGTCWRRAGDLTLKFGDFAMGGIGIATFGAIILYQILAWDRSQE
jgi:hypothetical protein